MASVNFFKDSFSVFAHFMMGDLQVYLPTLCCVQQFLTQNGMTPMPCSSYSPDPAPNNFFCLFLWMKKVLKGKCFVDVEKVKQKMAEALKVIKINEFKNCFEQWKIISIGLLHQIECILKVTKV